jgi:photosystem II stability/assembly factor-like uncharacterized protein
MVAEVGLVGKVEKAEAGRLILAGMDLQRRVQYRWLVIGVLGLPTLGLFGYSLVHPGIKGKDDRIFPGAAQVKAVAAVPASPWVMQNSGTDAGLRGIYSVDGKIAWASGTEGTVLRTTDGGEHWARCAVPDGDKDGATLDFRGVQAWDEKTAIVMASGPGDKSRLYKTVDGCRSWELLLKNEKKDGFWDALRMWDQKNGFLAGDPETNPDLDDPASKRLYLSEFTSWNGFADDSALYATKAKSGESAFAASNSSIALAPFRTKDGESREVWFATGGASGSRVIHYRHFNGGEPERTSTEVVDVGTFPRAESAGIFSISMRTDLHGVVVGGDYSKPTESSDTAAYSHDAGKTWTASTKPPRGYRSSVAWSDELKAWITAGTNGSDFSRDDGKTWAPLDDGNWNALALPFVVGPKGRIARLNAVAVK